MSWNLSDEDYDALGVPEGNSSRPSDSLLLVFLTFLLEFRRVFCFFLFLVLMCSFCLQIFFTIFSNFSFFQDFYSNFFYYLLTSLICRSLRKILKFFCILWGFAVSVKRTGTMAAPSVCNCIIV